jgi:hypothetical protein
MLQATKCHFGNGAQVNSVGSPAGTLAPSLSATVGFQVRIDNPFPANITQIANQGTVTSPQITNLPVLTTPPRPLGTPPVIPPPPTIVPIGAR